MKSCNICNAFEKRLLPFGTALIIKFLESYFMYKKNVDCTEPEIVSWPLSKRTTIFWLAGPNKYILAEAPANKVMERIKEKEDIHSIISFCSDEFNLSSEQAKAFVTDIQQFLSEFIEPEMSPLSLSGSKCSIQPKLANPASKRYYSIYGISFLVEYGTAEIELLIHPKFEHLEVPLAQDPNHHFQVLKFGSKCSFWVDGLLIGEWNWADSHFLSGKFSMQILQKIYQQEEDSWMAVLHAAGITNGENCILFLGDSGNGKSTLSAILLANGLDVLADDFLPVEGGSGFVCRFPAAISVKQKALELLIPKFPQLKEAREINNSTAGKTFRHLAAGSLNPLRVPCKALVFVKYEKDACLRFEEMSGDEAFGHLVPDSWISPIRENAHRFIKWFTALPYYRMTYSDNEMMVQTIKKLLNNDL